MPDPVAGVRRPAQRSSPKAPLCWRLWHSAVGQHGRAGVLLYEVDQRIQGLARPLHIGTGDGVGHVGMQLGHLGQIGDCL